MSEILGVLASEGYVTFSVAMKGEGTLGCLLPRSDAVNFVANAKKLMESNAHYFPEIDFKTGCMNIESAGAGLAVMFQCTEKNKDGGVQFALEEDICKYLIAKIEEVMKGACDRYGSPPVIEKPWQFTKTKDESEVCQESL